MTPSEAKEARLGLERSCSPHAHPAGRPGSWIRPAPSAPGMERAEAFFHGPAYRPHRHDTYAVGYTVSGVQGFDYRGETRHSVPGQVFVLHPDELHDGRAGNEEGFSYRILYIAPELIGEALGGGGLPFVRDPVSDDGRLAAATHSALADIDEPPDDLRLSEIALGLGEALAAASGETQRRPPVIDSAAVRRARDMLTSAAASGIDNAALERETGLIAGRLPGNSAPPTA